MNKRIDGIDWGRAGLGTKTDKAVAEALGVGRTTVTRRRRLLGVPSYRESPAVRFWANVTKSDGCWPFGFLAPSGYGVLSVRGSAMRAHRFSWELHRGPVPEGLHILHHCDNPACVRPSHLWLGTHADNMADMMIKQRHRAVRGVDHPSHKLTPTGVRDIRDRVSRGERTRTIAKDYGISTDTVRRVHQGKAWRHVK